MGPTKCAEAPAGTIRGDFGNKENNSQNVIHDSDSQENALTAEIDEAHLELSFMEKLRPKKNL